jgi:PAT family beta-lactamase induction signal transducer AmpG
MTSRRVLAWVAVLYVAQGLPYGVTSKIWPVWFRSNGVSLKEIGLMGLLSLPWSWKPLWAPLVDRFGPRRAWIAPALVALAALAATLPGFALSPVGPLLVATMLAFTISSATQDIAIDAWAVDASTGRKDVLGWMNGIRASAFRLAVIAAGGGALFVADRWGWRFAFLAVAAVFVALALAALRLPEPVRRETLDNRPSTRELVRAFLAWLLRREMIPIVLFALLFKIGDQAMARMTDPFWVDRGRSLSEIALVANTIGLALTVTGALLGGAFVARFGLFHGLLWLGIGQALSNLGFAAAAAVTAPQAIWAASMFENFTQGLGTAALLAFLTACCRPETAATEYALLSALFAFSREIAGALSGFGAQRMGYAGFFAFTALLAVPGLLLLPWLRPRLDAVPAAKGG